MLAQIRQCWPKFVAVEVIGDMDIGRGRDFDNDIVSAGEPCLVDEWPFVIPKQP